VAAKGEREVFPITVKGSGADEPAAGLERAEATRCPWSRRVKMFHYFGADDEIEWRLTEPT
jgi:hypothetical protein